MTCATWMGRAGAALVLLSCVADANPQSLRERFARAQSYADACRFGEAVAEGQAVLEQQARLGGPRLWQAEVFIADWLRADGRLSSAEHRARAALEAIEGGADRGTAANVQARSVYAMALWEMGKNDAGASMLAEARRLAETSAASDLEVAVLWKQTAILELSRNRPEAALSAVSRSFGLIGATPRTEVLRRDLLVLQAIAQLDNRDPAEAEKALRDAESVASRIADDRSGAQRHILRARAAILRSDLDGALGFLVEAEAENQRSPDACYRLFASHLHRARGQVAFHRRAAVDADAEFRAALAELDDGGRDAAPAEAGSLLFYLALTAQYLGDLALANQRYEAAASALRSAYGSSSEALSVVLASRSIAASEASLGEEARAWAEQALLAAQTSPDPSTWAVAHASAALGFAAAANNERLLAQKSFADAFAGFESLSGKNSVNLPPGLIVLAELDLEGGDLVSATERLLRALAIQEQQGWSSSLGVARTRSLLAEVYLRQGRRDDAREQTGRATEIVARRLSRTSGPISLNLLFEQRTAREIFERDLRIVEATRLGQSYSRGDIDRLARTMQYASASRTGAAVAQLAQRMSSSSDALGILLRDRVALLEQARAVEDRLIASAFDMNRVITPDQRRQARDELAEAERRVSAIDARLREEHGLQQALLIPEPANIDAVQASLKDTEALVSIVSAEQKTYVLFITKGAVRFNASALTRQKIEATVNKLRSVLDKDRWEPGSQFPAYDGEAAHSLYEALFGPASDMLANTSTLYVVADGALGAMPLGALLTERPGREASFSAYREWPWMVRRHAVVSMPSMASFIGLRSVGVRHVPSTQPFLGIGAVRHGGSKALLPGNPTPPDLGTLWRGSVANPDELRKFLDLPNSEAELRELATIAGASEDSVWLGENASERRLRSTDLSDYGVIAFSTHGVLSGELSGFAEPGLVLAPPAAASQADDGFLTASEIATLKINADWVLLSACSTAASDGRFDGEALSGLARAFFQAGARSLVVTYWPVDDNASRQFMRETLRLHFQGRVSSLAVRDAQLSVINEGARQYSHPMFWSGFAFVGVDPR